MKERGKRVVERARETLSPQPPKGRIVTSQKLGVRRRREGGGAVLPAPKDTHEQLPSWEQGEGVGGPPVVVPLTRRPRPPPAPACASTGPALEEEGHDIRNCTHGYIITHTFDPVLCVWVIRAIPNNKTSTVTMFFLLGLV